MDNEGSRPQAGPVVQAEDALGWETAEKAVVQHLLGAAIALFGRLEEQVDRTAELPGSGKVERRTDQHGHVPVMAAGMHLSWYRRSVWMTALLVDRQRVHIRTQRDRRSRSGSPDHSDNATTADSGMDLYTEFAKLLRNEGGGPFFFQRQFRMRMHRTTHRPQFGKCVRYSLKHRFIPSDRLYRRWPIHASCNHGGRDRDILHRKTR